MMRNNIKILTLDQLRQLNDKYEFEYDDESVIVKNKHYDRTTKHPRNKTFALNSKIRKVTINSDIISKWIELCEAGEEYSLLDVMQAFNKLYLMFQPMDIEHLKKMLERDSIRVKKVK